MKKTVYSEEELRAVIDIAVRSALRHLENGIDETGLEEEMPKNRQRVTVNGKTHWISGNTQQELCEAYLKLCMGEGVNVPTNPNTNEKRDILFGDYLKDFVCTYKSRQCSLTKENREMILRKHILPKFGKMPIGEITSGMLQRWFDELGERYSHETLLKIKNTMSPALDAAVEDGMIFRNPLKSGRLTIGGIEGKHHRAVPTEQMILAREKVPDLPQKERRLAALLCSTGMRFEEALGVKWTDISESTIRIERAVVHPKRNLAEIKLPKTKTSVRTIPIGDWLKDILQKETDRSGFVVYGKSFDEPMTYTEARRCFNKVRKGLGIDGYSAHDLRDTCATEWRENGMPVDLVARLLGHSKSEITEKRYVKYREQAMEEARGYLQPLLQKKGAESVAGIGVAGE